VLGIAAELIQRLGLEIAEKRVLAQHRQLAAYGGAQIARLAQAVDSLSYGPFLSHSPIAFLARKHATTGGEADKRKMEPGRDSTQQTSCKNLAKLRRDHSKLEQAHQAIYGRRRPAIFSPI